MKFALVFNSIRGGCCVLTAVVEIRAQWTVMKNILVYGFKKAQGVQHIMTNVTC